MNTLLQRQIEPVGDGADDAGIGLMRDDEGDVGGGQAGHFERLLRGFQHAGDGVLEGLAAFHVDGVRPLIRHSPA
jgi:hypothetical protein